MNLILKKIALLVSAALLVTAAHAHGDGERIAGPNGGRVLTRPTPHAEFHVTADRRVKITFLDEALKPIAPTNQIVTFTTGERSSPIRLTLERVGDSLVSLAALPEGTRMPAVIQFRTPGDRVTTERFTIDLSVCKECNLHEHACTCDH